MNMKTIGEIVSENVTKDEEICIKLGDEYKEDLQYLVDDFAKLKSNIVYNDKASPELIAVIMENFEEKLQRFQKRYGNGKIIK